MQQRLMELRGGIRAREKQLAALDQQRQMLRETLLRISGAIQVLEELLAAAQPGEDKPDSPV